MTPTTRFRFVIRYEPTPIRILQQWFEDHNNILYSTRTNETQWVKHYAGEWRDVPLEEEA